ncbi:MAG: type II toxin-antitoxin system RelE/ParE family toxin [Asticcacaulis sp.]|uniref:type II toxin-antitoxin system RelE/ParE family toxin n=1 Tax=Asticcacaulis sp. TaxID=1872648 RepID=UPI0039E680AD
MRVVFSSAFSKDLNEISDYIALDSPKRAFSFTEDIRQRCLSLGDMPESGAARPELGPNMRSVPFGRYVIFYIIYPDRLRIVRILHGARNLKTVFGGEGL